jgi:hypothetical protein
MYIGIASGEEMNKNKIGFSRMIIVELKLFKAL